MVNGAYLGGNGRPRERGKTSSDRGYHEQAECLTLQKIRDVLPAEVKAYLLRSARLARSLVLHLLFFRDASLARTIGKEKRKEEGGSGRDEGTLRVWVPYLRRHEVDSCSAYFFLFFPRSMLLVASPHVQREPRLIPTGNPLRNENPRTRRQRSGILAARTSNIHAEIESKRMAIEELLSPQVPEAVRIIS